MCPGLLDNYKRPRASSNERRQRIGSLLEIESVAVFISLMFWGWIWGIWGLLLAAPITAAIKAVCERVDDLQPFAELLSA